MLRLLASFALVGLWLLLLLTGSVPALVAHLLLAGGLVAFPWRRLSEDRGDRRDAS